MDLENLKKLLLNQHYISPAEFEIASKSSNNPHEFINYLIREQLLSKSLLGQAVAESYGTTYADLSHVQLAKELVTLLPEYLAREYHLVVYKVEDEEIFLASDAPEKINMEVLKATFLDKQIRIDYTLPEFVTASFNFYAQPLVTRFSNIIAKKDRMAPEIVDEIIKEALSLKASDIHFEPQADQVLIRFRIDGGLREAGKLQKMYYENVLNRIKVASGMRIDERMSSQDGAIQFERGDSKANLRVSLIPTIQGEKIVMRVLSSYVQEFTLADIGMNDTMHDKLEEHARKPFGMILTVGPTGSGKTTTLYALLTQLSKPDINVTTIEDPVEYKMPGINQIQVQEQSNMTFAKGLRSIVRQDPDIILVGEIRDRETAEIAVNAALTGHLLLSTFHANDAATTIPRLIDMGIEPFLLSSTLEAVVSQRLVRRICTHCRVAVPAAESLKKLPQSSQETVMSHFKADDNVYEGQGCTACNGSGYSGRVALFELLSVTPEIQDLILKRPTNSEIMALSREQGSSSMFTDGIEKINRGMTTLSEVLRVMEPEIKR